MAITVIDSLRYATLANALGINILAIKDKTAAVIIDASKESHYLMNNSFTYINLVEFVINFATMNLQPNLLSKAEPIDMPTHYQTIENVTKCDTNSICVDELTTHTFVPTVKQFGKVCLKSTPRS